MNNRLIKEGEPKLLDKIVRLVTRGKSGVDTVVTRGPLIDRHNLSPLVIADFGDGDKVGFYKRKIVLRRGTTL